jgi:hypothetical protein
MVAFLVGVLSGVLVVDAKPRMDERDVLDRRNALADESDAVGDEAVDANCGIQGQ